METKKKPGSVSPEGCALGGQLVSLVERPSLIPTGVTNGGQGCKPPFPWQAK